MNKHTNRSSSRAFTVIELLLVMFIVALLATTGAPLFAKMVQGSRVRQALVSIEAGLLEARSQAQDLRLHVAVFYGDNIFGRIVTPPVPNPVPKQGTIEVWTVKGSSGYGAFGGYGQTGPIGAPDASYPFFATVKLINKQPITLPANVRVIAGRFRRVWSGGTYQCIFDFPLYRKDSTGEIKRHETVFSQRGGLVRNDQNYAYNYLLIFDDTTGEHLVVEAGRCQTATRPLVLPYLLTHIGGTKITNYTQIPSLIDNYPGNM